MTEFPIQITGQLVPASPTDHDGTLEVKRDRPARFRTLELLQDTPAYRALSDKTGRVAFVVNGRELASVRVGVMGPIPLNDVDVAFDDDVRITGPVRLSVRLNGHLIGPRPAPKTK